MLNFHRSSSRPTSTASIKLLVSDALILNTLSLGAYSRVTLKKCIVPLTELQI